MSAPSHCPSPRDGIYLVKVDINQASNTLAYNLVSSKITHPYTDCQSMLWEHCQDPKFTLGIFGWWFHYQSRKAWDANTRNRFLGWGPQHQVWANQAKATGTFHRTCAPDLHLLLSTFRTSQLSPVGLDYSPALCHPLASIYWSPAYQTLRTARELVAATLALAVAFPWSRAP